MGGNGGNSDHLSMQEPEGFRGRASLSIHPCVRCEGVRERRRTYHTDVTYQSHWSSVTQSRDAQRVPEFWIQSTDISTMSRQTSCSREEPSQRALPRNGYHRSNPTA